jgi:predicted secreted hydrolase
MMKNTFQKDSRQAGMTKLLHFEPNFMDSFVLLVRTIILVLFLCFPFVSSAQEYLDVTSDYQVKIPLDFLYKQDYRVQWWYFTGHLFAGNGQEFGYELTFFVVNVQKRAYKSRFGVNRIYISHFAISDIAGNTFLFSDTADAGVFEYAGADDRQLKVWTGNNTLNGTFKDMRLRAADSNKSIDLYLQPVKPLVLNGKKGYSRKSEESPLIASVYFSYTQMNTKGKLTIGDEVYAVKGKSWFDREISTRGLSEKQAGWDWFAVQLDDNREIMIYMLRNKDGSINRYSSGTFIYRDGTYRHLRGNEFSVKVLSHYRSEKTGAQYPSQWEIHIPSETVNLRIAPLIQDQEVIALESTGNYYWEGTCRVEGSARGRAYVEMTGY